MQKYRLIAIGIGLASLLSSVSAAQLKVNALRFWTAPDHTRIVFDTSGLARHKIFLLDKPKRLVIDINNARLAKKLVQPPANHSLFTNIRSARRKQNDIRIVVDLKNIVTPKSFLLPPNKNYGHRLVIDLYNKYNNVVKWKPKTRPENGNSIVHSRKIIIAIDPGHGGDDPGALGSNGSQEKKVVLSIAKKLARYVNNHPRMEAVLIRKGDYYVGLRKRMQIARRAHADLFISIHADAFKNRRVKGASVFTLSDSGATSEAARWLANHENAADLVGGVSLDDKDNVLASVLIDLSQTASKEASQNIANKILRNFGKIGSLHKKSVQKARFVVLKSPDIPSILVETAFISNPDEERKLRNSSHQNKMARAIYNGIIDHYHLAKLPVTRIAATRHKITRGETLSGIAVRYGISMKKIKIANSLASSRIRIGQVLRIPRS